MEKVAKPTPLCLHNRQFQRLSNAMLLLLLQLFLTDSCLSANYAEHANQSSLTLLCLALAGGTFALYSLITRYAHIATPSGGSPNSSDLHLSRYTSNSMVESSQRQGPKTTSERVRDRNSTSKP